MFRAIFRLLGRLSQYAVVGLIMYFLVSISWTFLVWAAQPWLHFPLQCLFYVVVMGAAIAIVVAALNKQHKKEIKEIHAKHLASLFSKSKSHLRETERRLRRARGSTDVDWTEVPSVVNGKAMVIEVSQGENDNV